MPDEIENAECAMISANVLRVLGLQDDFLKLGADDIIGRKLQDIELLRKN